MRHVDGISVRLRLPGIGYYKEYHNPHKPQPDHFEGRLGRRLGRYTPGCEFEVILKFEKNFKLFRVSGIYVIVAIGGADEQLDHKDNFQSFWIGAGKTKQNNPHKLRFFRTWETYGPITLTRDLPMQIPAPAGECTTVLIYLRKHCSTDYR